MSTTFQRKPSILQKLLFFCCCFSLGPSGVQLHTWNVYTAGQHIAHPLYSENPCRQAGRQAGVSASNNCRTRDSEALMKALLKKLKYFSDTWRKQSVIRRIITHHDSHTKSYLNFWPFCPSLHPKIFPFLFFLSLFSSSSTQPVLLALWADLQDPLLTYFSIVIPAALIKKLGRTKRLSSRAAKSSNELHQRGTLH